VVSSLNIATYFSAAAGKARRILPVIKQRVENRRENIYCTVQIGGMPMFQELSVALVTSLKGMQAEHAHVSGVLCSSHGLSQRDASRSQWSTCCLFLISDRPVWTHYWQMAVQQCLETPVSLLL